MFISDTQLEERDLLVNRGILNWDRQKKNIEYYNVCDVKINLYMLRTNHRCKFVQKTIASYCNK